MWSCLAISVLSHPCSSSSVICRSRGPKRTDVSFIPIPFPDQMQHQPSCFVNVSWTVLPRKPCAHPKLTLPDPSAFALPPYCSFREKNFHISQELQGSAIMDIQTPGRMGLLATIMRQIPQKTRGNRCSWVRARTFESGPPGRLTMPRMIFLSYSPPSRFERRR